MTQAEMNRSTVTGGFQFGAGFVLAAAILGLVLKKDHAQSMGQRRALMPDVIFQGAARPRARVMGVRLGQDEGGMLVKRPGDVIDIQVVWAALTTDFQGSPSPGSTSSRPG